MTAHALMPGPGSAHWEQTLHDIPEPELHALAPEAPTTNAPFFTTADLAGMHESQVADEYFVPEDFRRYQNSHKAPTRIYTGCTAVTIGGIMMVAGYKQDTKYEWSGPYMSPSPLNVFGILIIALGIAFIVSGVIFYSKYKKHTIMPYNKSY
jgi:hypothetical protein